MQGMVTEPLFLNVSLLTASPISTEKSVYTEFPDTTPLSVFLLNKKHCATLMPY